MSGVYLGCARRFRHQEFVWIHDEAIPLHKTICNTKLGDRELNICCGKPCPCTPAQKHIFYCLDCGRRNGFEW